MFDQLSMFDPSPQPAPSVLPSRLEADRPLDDDLRTAFHNLFFAGLARAADAERLHARGRQVAVELGLGGSPLEADRLHVSLHAVAAYGRTRPDADIAKWCSAAATVRCAPFEVVFDRVASFGGEGNPLVFTSSDNAGLLALHQAVGIALANSGEVIKQRRITPHMTLSYRGKRIAETPIEPIRWRVAELVLIDSHVGAHRHDVVGRWPLQD